MPVDTLAPAALQESSEPTPPPMVVGYLTVIESTYNKLAMTGRLDHLNAMCMVGLLIGAAIGLAYEHENSLARLLEDAARRLDGDWRSFSTVIPPVVLAMKQH